MEVTAKKSIAILGAGITGLTAAHRLHKLGHQVQVFDQAARVGGAIGTEITAGWLVEHGPNSLLENEPAASALITELGLNDERVTVNTTAGNRYIVRNGRPVAVPLDPADLLTSRLFSLSAKLRILGELFSRPRARTDDISLAQFMRDHFGAEFVAYALNPFVNGVYAGDPMKLSARYAFPALWQMERSHGSIIRGQVAKARQRRAQGDRTGGIISFKRGLQTLTEALAGGLPAGCVHLGVTIQHLAHEPRWSVIWHDGRSTHSDEFDAVVTALPASGLAGLRFGSMGDRPLASLSGVVHPPVASLYLGFHRSQVTHALDGFGLLVPACEERSVLGVIFSSSLFPNRAPADYVGLTVMGGGTRQPEIAALEPAALLTRVLPDLAALLGVKGEPVFMRHTRWPRAIPQYNLGYEQHFATMTAAECTYPGLFIGGQVRDGIAVPACIVAGEKLAARAAAN